MKNFLIIFFSVYTIFAQNIGSWKNYTSMKNTFDLAVYHDKIWCASDGGIFEFNSSDSSFVEIKKNDGLNSQFVSAVAFDSVNQNLWIGTTEGFLNVYNLQNHTIEKLYDINRSNFTKKAIKSIQVYGDTVIVGLEFGMSLLNAKTFQFIETTTKFGNFSSSIEAFDINYDKIFYVCTNEGLAVQKAGSQNLSNPDAWLTFSKTSLGVDRITSCFNYSSLLTISSSKGFYQYNNGSWTKFLSVNDSIANVYVVGDELYYTTRNKLFYYSPSLSNPYIELFSDDFLKIRQFKIHGNDFMIASNQGLVFNGKKIIPNGPPSNSFQNMDIDNDGNLWVGTGKDVFGVGFSKFDRNEWTNYNTATLPMLLSNAFHNVYAAPDNSIYFMNWGKGFTRLKNKNFSNFYINNTDLVGIPAATSFLVIDDIVADKNNNVWILNHWAANGKVLSVLTADSAWFHYEIGSPLSPQIMQLKDQLVIDDNGTKWFVSISGTPGLYYFKDNGTLSNLNDDTWGRLTNSEYFGGQSIQSLVIDNNGEMWVGTGLGVYIIPDLTRPTSRIFSVFTLRQQTINCIAVDPINNKWVGTKQGLFITSSDGSYLIAQYDSKNSPLPTDEIKSITFDDESGLAYIGTDFGLSILSTEFIRPKNNSKNLFVYPNPFVIQNSMQNQITIDGLFADANIKIITIDGKLVIDFRSSGGRLAFWDGRDNSGNLVNSGIYLIIAYDMDGNKILTTKVAVVKK